MPCRAPTLAVLALACGAILADSPAPRNRGVVCLSEPAPTLVAITQWQYGEDFGGPSYRYNLYATHDGGLTWSDAGAFDPATWSGPDKKDPCAGRTHAGTWTLSNPQPSAERYLFLSGDGIFISDDGGQTYRREATAERVIDAVQDPATGNLIAAIGGNQVLVRTPDGKWQTALVVAGGN